MDDSAQLLHDALGLNPGARAHLASELSASLKAEVVPDAEASWRDQNGRRMAWAHLASELIASLEAEVAPDASWRDQIRRRMDAVEDGTAELEDWSEVRARLWAAVPGDPTATPIIKHVF